MRNKIIGIIIPIAILLSGCLNVIIHEEQDAAKEASKFINAAVLDKDYEQAYSLLSDTSKGNIDFTQFKQICVDMHPSGFPTSIIATEFEPVPGQKVMNIFLLGRNESEEFYYRVLMVGTKPSGYTVDGFFRSNKKPPESSLRGRL